MTGVSRKLSERERSRLKNIVSKVAPKDMGVIIRTAAEGASEEAITKDLESLVRQWERITSKRDEFLHGKRPKLLQGEPDVAIRVVRDIFNDDFSKMIVEGDRVYGRIEEYLDTMAPDLKDKLEKWDPPNMKAKTCSTSGRSTPSCARAWTSGLPAVGRLDRDRPHRSHDHHRREYRPFHRPRQES